MSRGRIFFSFSKESILIYIVVGLISTMVIVGTISIVSSLKEANTKKDEKTATYTTEEEPEEEMTYGSPKSIAPNVEDAKEFLAEHVKGLPTQTKYETIQNIQIQHLTSADKNWVYEKFLGLDLYKKLQELEERKNEKLIIDGFLFYVIFDIINTTAGTKQERENAVTVVKRNDSGFVIEDWKRGH